MMSNVETRRVDVINKIVDMLTDAGHSVERDGQTITKVNDVRIDIKVFPESTGGPWRPYHTGKLRLVMNTGKDAYSVKNYPEPKIGLANPKTIQRIEEAVLRISDFKKKKMKRKKKGDLLLSY
jgi:hypothetical protein